MGLDFTVYSVKKGSKEEHKLAYGRKSWELVSYLKCDPKEYRTELRKEDWVHLMANISLIAPRFKEFNKAADILFWSEKEYDEKTVALAEKSYLDFCDWYDKIFDEGPTLGYDFALGYIENFWEADTAVREALDDKDTTIYMEASW